MPFLDLIGQEAVVSTRGLELGTAKLFSNTAMEDGTAAAPKSAAHQRGGTYWRQRTQVAVGDSHAAAGSWASLLRGEPTWGG